MDPQQVVKLVINFDLPLSEDSYLLRIGRVGRFGRKAVVVNFENPGEIGTLGWFETRRCFPLAPIPKSGEIIARLCIHPLFCDAQNFQ